MSCRFHTIAAIIAAEPQNPIVLVVGPHIRTFLTIADARVAVIGDARTRTAGTRRGTARTTTPTSFGGAL